MIHFTLLPIKFQLFTYAPVVVDPKDLAEAEESWRNIIGTVPTGQNISPRELADTYEEIYAKVLRNADVTQRKQEAQYPTRPNPVELKAQLVSQLFQKYNNF